MRDSAGVAGLFGFAVVGAFLVAGGARAESESTPPVLVEMRVPALPPRTESPVPFSAAGGLEGFAVRVGEAAVLTPAVEGRRVFAGDLVEMRAFDAVDGRRLWSAKVDDSQPSAPAVSSGHVYFNTQSCTVYDVEASTGKRDWSQLVASSVASTPAILGDRLFVTGPAQAGGWKLEAYAARTGELAFRIPLSADVLSAPVASGDQVFLALADGTVLAVDRDGKEAWRRDVKALAAPWPTADRLLVACGSAGDPELLNLDRATGSSDERAVATPRDGAKNRMEGPAGPKAGGGPRPAPQPVPPVSPGAGLGGGPGGKGRGPLPPVVPPSTPSGSGSVAGSFGYEGPRPCVLGQTVAVVAGEDLVLRNLSGGEIRRVPLGAGPAGAPVAAGTLFVQATRDGRIHGIDPATGALRFRVSLVRGGAPLPLFSSPAVWRGRAYVGTPDGMLLVFDLPDPSADGWPMWGGSATRAK